MASVDVVDVQPEVYEELENRHDSVYTDVTGKGGDEQEKDKSKEKDVSKVKEETEDSDENITQASVYENVDVKDTKDQRSKDEQNRGQQGIPVSEANEKQTNTNADGSRQTIEDDSGDRRGQTSKPQEIIVEQSKRQTIVSSSVNSTVEEEMNPSPMEKGITKKLKQHFSDPYTRVCRETVWYKKCPEKLIVLIIKFFFVTAQLCMFGTDRAEFAKYLERNNIAMKHLLLKEWQREFETMPYPPSSGVYAVYTIDDLLDHINFTVKAIDEIPTRALGSFFVNDDGNQSKPIKMCLEYFKRGTYKSGKVEMDSTILSECRQVGLNNPNETYGFDPSLEDLIRRTNGNLVRLLHVNLSFSIDSVFVHLDKTARNLQCFTIYGVITFDNRGINGQVPVTLKTQITEKTCQGGSAEQAEIGEWVVAILVIGFSLLSTFFSIWAFICSCILTKKTMRYFKETQGKIETINGNLSWVGKVEIVKLRDLTIVLSDILTITGSIWKLILNNKNISNSSHNYDTCGILIGIGCLLVWLGVLHYFAYDPDFYLLFSVMWISAGKVLKFLLSVGMLYLAFALCGWVVLGPYHLKFTDISSSVQCLMSLLNGDEIYVTYSAVEGDKLTVWWFNVIFVTVFVVVFTLITLNIFIAIFNSAYEAIRNKEHKSDLATFLKKDDLNKIDVEECKKHCHSRKGNVNKLLGIGENCCV